MIVEIFIFKIIPFNFNYEKDLNFFLEDYLIKNCPYNSNWIIKTYGMKEYDKIYNKTILCSGTVLVGLKKLRNI